MNTNSNNPRYEYIKNIATLFSAATAMNEAGIDGNDINREGAGAFVINAISYSILKSWNAEDKKIFESIICGTE